MSYKVLVYFDNMLDEEYKFKTEKDASKCHDQLRRKYQGQRLYKVKMEEVEEEVIITNFREVDHN
ncbi:hypothetical protein GBL85_07580 [Streptococcus equi]|uniref:DUF7204 family protein n=1 Tax=Streptococcus equi TaxID=1336 RepID=UPI0006581AAB|nr:hypothetical protein [Streptococcus equi]MCD3537528.1 hypothetical protein [Streptococcus equi subsp. equi]MCD3561130.1 hypothetical protein [Streptococcus equi subsp. equi]MCD3563764.1 hypothetical protein [Streptococcus equi subsp. equi]NBK66899.1 hypothetical protein [Streptococcus equi]NBL33979.1 hypothetical protein [Streptococcus equi]